MCVISFTALPKPKNEKSCQPAFIQNSVTQARLKFSQVGHSMTPLGISGNIAHQTMTLTIAADKGRGLTSAEARARLNQFGPNAVAEEKPHPLKAFLKRFWAPIPWLLEASIQLYIGETVEAVVIGGLLVCKRRVELPTGGPRAKGARFAPATIARPGAGAARRPVDHASGRRTGPG